MNAWPLALRLGAAALAVGGAAALTWVVTGGDAASETGIEPRAWIDAPVSGSVLPVEPVDVVAHATDLDGIATIEIAVDGAQVARIDTDGGALVEVVWLWEPGPGTYTITATGIDRNGDTGAAGAAIVTFGESPPVALPSVTPSAPSPSASESESASESPSASTSPSPTPTTSPTPTSSPTLPPSPTTSPSPSPTTSPSPSPSPTPTPTPTTSPSPTPTPSPSPSTTPACQPGAPTATGESQYGAYGFIFEWAYNAGTCPLDNFWLQVSTSEDFSSIYRSTNEPDGTDRSWQDPDPYPSCTGPYYWRVRGVVDGRPGPWSNVETFTPYCVR